MSDPVTRTDAAEEPLPADEPPDAPVPWQRSDAESMRPAEDGEAGEAREESDGDSPSTTPLEAMARMKPGV